MQSEPANLRRLPKAAWVLFFGTFLNKFGTFVVPFLAIYLARLGFSMGQAGLAIGAYGVGTLLAAALGGHLADTLGRRKTIVLSMFSVAGIMLCLSQARSLPTIVFLSGLAGLTGELYRPAGSALLADVVPSGQRVMAFAAYRIAFNAGFAFGPATAGFLAQKSFFWLFVGDAATSVLFGLVAWLALPSGPRAPSTNGNWAEALIAIRRDRAFLQLLGGALVIGLVFMQFLSSLSLELTRHGFSAATYGMLISFNGLLVTLFELPLTTLTRRFSATGMIGSGFILMGIGFALNALPLALWGFVLTMTLFTLGEMVSMPIAVARVADLAPVHLRGRYLGAYGLVWAVAFIGGPSLGLWLYSYSPCGLWLGCGGLGLLAALIVWL